jgi:gamma-glutamylcyclotransferase (GGCT)/AIG2-like uncharacterized protein YtfP
VIADRIGHRMPTLFLYGTSLPGQPEHRWIAGLPMRPASVRGALWRSPRNRPALVPDPDGLPIQGVLVEVDDARLAVLDLVETVGQDLLRRAAVRVALHLRSTEAQAWVLPPAERQPPGWRRLKLDSWARMASR